MPRSALTLLELLSVTAIVGLMAASAGVVAARLGSRPDGAREAAEAVIEGLRRLRDHPGPGGVTIGLDARGFEHPRAEASVRLPPEAASASWTREGIPQGELTIDPNGRSEDVELEVASRSTRYRLLISGLTGAVTRLGGP